MKTHKEADLLNSFAESYRYHHDAANPTIHEILNEDLKRYIKHVFL